MIWTGFRGILETFQEVRLGDQLNHLKPVQQTTLGWNKVYLSAGLFPIC